VRTKYEYFLIYVLFKIGLTPTAFLLNKKQQISNPNAFPTLELKAEMGP
jgi:hypothetical protein